jgi:hypothetical protein
MTGDGAVPSDEAAGPPAPVQQAADLIAAGRLTLAMSPLARSAQARRRRLGRAAQVRWPELVVFGVATPLAYLAYDSAAGPTASGAGWSWLIVLNALVAGAVLATYARRVGAGSPCAAGAGLQVLLAALLLNLGPSVPMRGLLAFGVLTLALTQRLSGAGSCPAR